MNILGDCVGIYVSSLLEGPSSQVLNGEYCSEKIQSLSQLIKLIPAEEWSTRSNGKVMQSLAILLDDTFVMSIAAYTQLIRELLGFVAFTFHSPLNGCVLEFVIDPHGSLPNTSGWFAALVAFNQIVNLSRKSSGASYDQTCSVELVREITEFLCVRCHIPLLRTAILSTLDRYFLTLGEVNESRALLSIFCNCPHHNMLEACISQILIKRITQSRKTSIYLSRSFCTEFVQVVLLIVEDLIRVQEVPLHERFLIAFNSYLRLMLERDFLEKVGLLIYLQWISRRM
jgi:hypothetical protein